MFTGIVTAIGEVVEAERKGPSLKRLAIACPYEAEGIAIGASIACAGVCLTVTALRPRTDGAPGCIFQVEAAAETLAKTTVGNWEPGTRINLERSLKVGEELGGHLVTGHVDGVGEVLKFEPVGESHELIVRAPAAIAGYIAKKGSITINGVSLTVNAVTHRDFSINLIPHTVAMTNLKHLRPGSTVNLEIDLIARYVERMLAWRSEQDVEST